MAVAFRVNASVKLTLVDSNLPELLDAHPFDSKRIEDFSSAVSDSTATADDHGERAAETCPTSFGFPFGPDLLQSHFDLFETACSLVRSGKLEEGSGNAQTSEHLCAEGLQSVRRARDTFVRVI